MKDYLPVSSGSMHYRRSKRRRRKTGKVVGFIVAALLLLAAALVIRAYTYPFVVPEGDEGNPAVSHTVSEQALQRFSGGIRIPTVSSLAGKEADNPFERFKQYLPEAYPGLYAVLDTMTVNSYGLLFHWKGKDTGKKPLLFLAHYDVVPVRGYDPETDEAGEPVFRFGDTPKGPVDTYPRSWDYPPFSGAVADGRIYGRGTLDDKGTLFALMEAADTLVGEGFQPEQDIWFAFGFDEEIGGLNGAAKIAAYFREQGITFEAVYDEGGIITTPGQAGLTRSMALVGVSEKGGCNIRITVRGKGGHSSMPSRKESLVLAAEIIGKLNENQMPPTLTEPISAFLDRTGTSMGFFPRVAIANKWLLKCALLNAFGKDAGTNALIRTTTAITMAQGSEVPNVLSSAAVITVNFRILTGESVQMVADHVTKICEGYDATIEVMGEPKEPSLMSPADTPGFRSIEKSLARVYPGVTVSPYICVAATDARKYEEVSKNIYRFIPMRLNEFEQRTMHNENEYISIENYAGMIAFYREIMKESSSSEEPEGGD